MQDPKLGLLPNQPSQTIPAFDETMPAEQALGQPVPVGQAAPAPAPGQPGQSIRARDIDPTMPDVEISQEQIKQFQYFVNNGTKLIHAPETRDQIIDSLQKIKPAEKALGDLTLVLVRRLDKAAQDAGTTFDDLVKLDGANVLMGQLAEVGEAAGVLQADDTIKQKAYSYAVQEYIREGIARGTLDPQEVEKGLAAIHQRQLQINPEQAAMTEQAMQLPSVYDPAVQEALAQQGQPAPAPQGQPAPAPQGQPAPAPQGLLGGVA